MILGKTGVYYHVFYLTDSQQVTDALLVPPLVLFLVNNPLVHKFTLSSLKHVFSGAAPLAKKLEENVKKRIASIEAVQQGWNTKPKLACEYSCLSFLLATLRWNTPSVKGCGEMAVFSGYYPNWLLSYFLDDYIVALKSKLPVCCEYLFSLTNYSCGNRVVRIEK